MVKGKGNRLESKNARAWPWSEGYSETNKSQGRATMPKGKGYRFESKDTRAWPWSRGYSKADKALDRATMEGDLTIATKATDAVNEYLDEVPRNIYWYVINRKKQEKIYYLYMGLTLSLVIIIPLVSYLIPVYAKGVTSGVVGAQLTTILTGGFAIHRLITGWLFRRNTALAFWRAGSDLKTLQHELVNRWRGRDEANLVPLFKQDLRAASMQARAIVNIETESHFASFSNVGVDLGQVMTSATATAKNLINEFSGSVMAEMQKAKTAADDRSAVVASEHALLVESRAKGKFLIRQMMRLEAELKVTKDPQSRKAIEEKLRDRKAQLENTELDVATRQARFSAMAEVV